MNDAMSDYETFAALIDERLEDGTGLTADDILKLLIARRLNRLSDSMFAQALGNGGQVPLNFWGKR